MYRTAFLLFSLATCALVLPEGRSAESSAGILELALPDTTEPPPWGEDHVSKLEIDGKDRTTPRLKTRTIKVDPKKGTDTVTVVYTYWPTVYMQVTRTKVVKVVPGETVKVDFHKADPARPDKIFVIYVPTPMPVVDAMCKMAKVGKDDVVMDIGCGDGRLVIQAVKKYGAKRGVGIDISAERIRESRENARKAGVSDRLTFVQKDALTIKDFSEASVVLLYLGEPLNLALRPALRKTLAPGSRVVSHRFRMGDWKPDRTERLTAKDNEGDEADFELHLWTIGRK